MVPLSDRIDRRAAKIQLLQQCFPSKPSRYRPIGGVCFSFLLIMTCSTSPQDSLRKVTGKKQSLDRIDRLLQGKFSLLSHALYLQAVEANTTTKSLPARKPALIDALKRAMFVWVLLGKTDE